jgi:hypothetical protein
MQSEILRLSHWLFNKVNFIEPIIEAVINSIQANATNIIITTKRKDKTAAEYLANEIYQITIQDNGDGFAKARRDSFEVIAKTDKIKEKCRGIGRLSYIRVFERIFFCSNFLDEKNDIQNVRFFFNANFTKIKSPRKQIANNTTGTKIIFDKLIKRDIQNKDIGLSSKALLNDIVRNKQAETFSSVIYTALIKTKKITIKVDGDSFVIDNTNITWNEIKFDIEDFGEIFIKYAFHDFNDKKLNDSDYIAYQVGDRAVKQIFPSQAKFEFANDKSSLSLICFVSNEKLNEITNNNWRDFNLGRDKWNKINKAIQIKIYNDIISSNLQEDIAQKQKDDSLRENPHLKLILDEYDKSLFLNKSQAVEKAAREKEDILQPYFSSKTDTDELFKDENNEKNINIIQQSALAELMITRFRTLEDAYTKCNSKDVAEKDIHNILFTQKTNSNSIKNNNLWLLDARWQYSKHIESDNSINDIFSELSIEKLYEKHNLQLTEDDKNNIEKDKRKFNKRPDICIFNESSVVIVELKKPSVDLSFHIEKIKLYGALISFISKQKYRNIYGYLIGKDKPTLTDRFYKEDFDNMGYSFTTELALLEQGKTKRTDLSDTTFYGGILEYNKFLKDCYMQHYPFFEKIGKNIEALDKYIPQELKQ